MEALKFLLGVFLPYLALLVFVGGMLYRLARWKKLASPPMTLYPAPPDEAGNLKNLLKETLFFKSLFHGDRWLWVLAWLFHVVLALIFVGHFRVFTNVDAIFMKMGMSEQAILAMSGGAGGAAGVIILVTAIVLLVRRLVVQRAREITSVADYFALALIGLIVFTGDIMRFSSEHFDLSDTRSYFAGLATFSNVAGDPLLDNGVFLLHMTLALLLFMYIPFSKILHLGGFFFTHQLIRKN